MPLRLIFRTMFFSARSWGKGPHYRGRFTEKINQACKVTLIAFLSIASPMSPSFQLLRQTRQNLLGLIEGLSLARLNYIPANFRNNLYWHTGHVLVTQQLLLYKNSGQPMKIPQEWVDAFRKGTTPDGQGNADTLGLIKTRLLSSVEEAWQDYQSGLFAEYAAYPTSYGYQLDNIDDALRFNSVHEGMHLGYAQAMRHLL
jgi:hypothetical protein